MVRTREEYQVGLRKAEEKRATALARVVDDIERLLDAAIDEGADTATFSLFRFHPFENQAALVIEELSKRYKAAGWKEVTLSYLRNTDLAAVTVQ